MEQDSHEVKIYKDGELIATASHVRKVNVPWPWSEVHTSPDALPDPVVFTCYHLPQIKLERMIIFRVLNRQPLSSIFNDSGIEIGEERVEPLYYINGLVETIRGNPTISNVVLTKPNLPVDKREFAKRLPELYKRFSALL
jgi:hypothetical protein